MRSSNCEQEKGALLSWADWGSCVCIVGDGDGLYRREGDFGGEMHHSRFVEYRILNYDVTHVGVKHP